jgi:hypothetical protein
MKIYIGWQGMTLLGIVGAVIGGFFAVACYPDANGIELSGASLGFAILTFPTSIMSINYLKSEYNSAKLTLFVDLANKKIGQLQTELISFDRLNHSRYLHVIISDLEEYLTEIRNIVGRTNWRNYRELKGILGTYKTTLTDVGLDNDLSNRTLDDLKDLLRGLPDDLNDLLQAELSIKN